MDLSAIIAASKSKTLNINKGNVQITEKLLSSIFSNSQNNANASGGGYQEYFKTLLKLKNVENKEMYSYHPGDTLYLWPELKYMLSNPPSVGMIFHVQITMPDGSIVDCAPHPSASLPINLNPPHGNNKKWNSGFYYNAPMDCYYVHDFETKIFPLTFNSDFPLGNYRIKIVSIYFEDEMSAEISWDTKTFRLSVPVTPTYTISKYTRPVFHDHQRIEQSDMNSLAENPRKSMALTQAVLFDAQSGPIDGMKLNIKEDGEGRFVEIKEGYGTIFSSMDDVIGNHLLIIDKPIKVGYFNQYAPPAAEDRWDIIEVGIDTVLEGESDGSVGDKRIFVDPKGIDQLTGRPKRYSKVVPTRSKIAIKTLWTPGISGDDSESYARSKKATANYFKLGYIVNSRNVDNQKIVMESFPSMTVKQHREKVPLDHQDRSIQANHIDSDIIGNFVAGQDMDLKTIGDQINSAKGTASTIGARIGTVIAEDGTLIREPIKEIIEEVLSDLFSNLIDSKGNLKSGALNQAGLLTKGAAVMGVVSDNGFVQLPFGYPDSQCAWMAAIANVAFSPGDMNRQAKWIRILCNINGRRVSTQAVVKYSLGGSESEGTYHGSANFISIGFKTS